MPILFSELVRKTPMRETTKRLMSSTAAIPVLFGLALAVPAAKPRNPCKAAKTG